MSAVISVLLPIYVTMLLGYAAAAHREFDATQVPVLNKVVLLYAVPMSIAANVLKTSRATLQADLRTVLVIAVAFVGVYVVAFGLMRWLARCDLETTALRALTIAFPAVPFIGPSLLTPLFGASSALLIVVFSLVGNILIVPVTTMCVSIGASQHAAPGRPAATPTSMVTVAGHAMVDALKQPLVWGPVLALLIVLLGFQAPAAFDNSLSLLGQAASGVALFMTEIVLQSQRASLSPAVIVNTLGRNVVAPLAMLGIASVFGLSAAVAHQVAVTDAIIAPPIIVSLAIQYGVAKQEMSSTLLLSALASPLTLGAFMAFGS